MLVKPCIKRKDINTKTTIFRAVLNHQDGFFMRVFLAFIVFSLAFAIPEKVSNVDDLDKVVDDWHLAATNADFEGYFGAVTDDFVFLGTDPKERWTKKEFSDFFHSTDFEEMLLKVATVVAPFIRV